MTSEEIKKIAEEYADYCSVPVRTYPHYTRLKEEAEDVIEFLTERFYLVERGKAIAKYNEVKKLNTICDDMFADDTAVFEYLFGPDIRKEEEE